MTHMNAFWASLFFTFVVLPILSWLALQPKDIKDAMQLAKPEGQRRVALYILTAFICSLLVTVYFWFKK